MQGSARKDVVFGAARVYTVTVPGPKWKSWLIQAIHPKAARIAKYLRHVGRYVLWSTSPHGIDHRQLGQFGPFLPQIVDSIGDGREIKSQCWIAD